MKSTATTHHTDEGTFLRAALLLGLVRGEAVVAWADGIIDREPSPSAEIIELAMTPAGDLTAQRLALLPFADAVESPAVVDRLIACAARDLAEGRRTMPDTIRVLGQIRRMVAVPDALKEPLNRLEYDHVLAVHVGSDIAGAEQRVAEWLVPFAEAHR